MENSGKLLGGTAKNEQSGTRLQSYDVAGSGLGSGYYLLVHPNRWRI